MTDELSVLVNQITEKHEQHLTHLRRLSVSMDNLQKSLSAVKWIIETAAEFLPSDRYELARQDVRFYAERLIAFGEAAQQEGEDVVALCNLYKEVVDRIPRKENDV